MRVTGLRTVGARVELIEVGEPRPLAGDEVLLEVMAAGVGNWDEFVREAAGMWGANRRWRWAWRRRVQCWRRGRRSAGGRPVMR